MGYNVTTLDQAQVISLKNKVEDLMLENLENARELPDFQSILSIPYEMDLTGNPQGVIRFLTALRPFEEWKGEVSKQTLESKGLQIIPRQFSNTITSSIHDLKMGINTTIYQGAKMLGTSAVQKEIESVCKFFEDAATIKGYDGAAYFGNGHSNGQDNDLDKTGNTDAIPTVTVAEAEILKAISAMQGFKNEQGSPMYFGGFSGKPLTILAPTVLYPVLKKLEYLDEITSGVTNGLKGMVKVISAPVLSNGDANTRYCYLIDSTMPVKPLFKVVGYPLETDMYEDKNSRSMVFTANMAYEMGPADWKASIRFAFKS